MPVAKSATARCPAGVSAVPRGAASEGTCNSRSSISVVVDIARRRAPFGPVRGIHVNDLGEVGLKFTPDPTGLEGTPYFWSSTAGLIPLPVLGVSGITAGNDINNAGEMVGASAGIPVIWRPLTSAGDALDELEEVLDNVLDGGAVDVEGGNGLAAKLAQIRAHLEAGRANAARNQLGAFVNQVEAMIADGRLSADEGAELLAAAAALAGLLA